VWGIDITYIRLQHDWMYLVAILDWFVPNPKSWTQLIMRNYNPAKGLNYE